MPSAASAAQPSDRAILGYSRWIVFICAFLAMGVISPYEYAWSSMAGHIGGLYHWSHTQIGWMFTLFVVFESIGTLPGGVLRDKFGPRWVTVIGGIMAGIGIYATSLGPSYAPVLIIWCIGSLFAGFIYNSAITTANKWFPDRRGVAAGLIAGAFSWGSLPFIFPIRAIPKTAPDAVFFHVIYIMAAIIGGVAIVTALFMKDPPAGWRPPGWVAPTKAVERPSEHQYTLGEALQTWQMWVLIISFILISSAGLAGVSKIVRYSNSFHFAAAAATAAAGGLTISNGLGRVVLGSLSERIGRENAMIGSYILTGIFLFLTIAAGTAHSETMFVLTAVLALFFWGPLFSLFPAIIGHYFGEVAAGSNYGLLYAIAKGSGGIYGGVLSAVLITQNGFPFAMGVAGVMAIVAGLLIIPLKFSPPVWQEVSGREAVAGGSPRLGT
ncbi:MAG TPA: OFA family MFS transporter [Stellaceae bacterium]|nr:OFA family MFS transporter [Stellaceae bacterium]